VNPLIPSRLLLQFEFPLAYRARSPRIDGRLRDWTTSELLPTWGEIDGEKPFAAVWACWNEQGIGIAARVNGRRSRLQCDPASFWKGDNLRLMLDTRDTRHLKRGTRFCHHVFLLPCGGPEGAAIAGGHPMRGAKEQAPPIAAGTIDVADQIEADGYSLEAFIPGAALCGFDPSQHRRIGFYYMLEDRDLGRQSLTIGDDLPWSMDPSLWATAALEREP
jgi:hypothetical protein